MTRRRAEIDGQQALDVPPAPPLRAHRTAVPSVRAAWSKIKVRARPKCDWCLREQSEGLRTAAASLATYRRKQGPHVDLLCYRHANAQRLVDGLKTYH